MNIDFKLQEKIVHNNFNNEIEDDYFQVSGQAEKINLVKQILFGTIYISLLVLSLFVV